MKKERKYAGRVSKYRVTQYDHYKYMKDDIGIDISYDDWCRVLRALYDIIFIKEILPGNFHLTCPAGGGDMYLKERKNVGQYRNPEFYDGELLDYKFFEFKWSHAYCRNKVARWFKFELSKQYRWKKSLYRKWMKEGKRPIAVTIDRAIKKFIRF